MRWRTIYGRTIILRPMIQPVNISAVSPVSFVGSTWGAVYAPARDKMRALIAEKEAYLKGNPDDAYVHADLRAMQGALENAKTIHASPT